MFRLLAQCLSSNPLRRFSRDNRGSATVELVITLPLLMWALVATVVFFDGYRARYHAQMAAQTVADIMSRETDMFTAQYIEGLNGVFDFLADSRYPTRIRVSSVIWDPTNERNRLQWSYGTRSLTPLPTDTFELMQAGDVETLLARFGDDASTNFAGASSQMPIANLPDRIPPVLPGEALLLVEAFALWEPFASIGLGQLRFAPVVVVRPRFAPWINFDGVEPIFPDADYEIAWTGGGNDSLPDPNDDPDPVEDPDPTTNTYAFDNGVTTGWSASTVQSGGPTGAFLGPFANETWNTPVTLAVDLGISGSNATIAFDLLIIDSWDAFSTQYSAPRGDIFQILVDGTPVSWDPFSGWPLAPFDNARETGLYLNNATYRVAMTRTRSGSNFAGSSYNDQVWRVTMTITNAPQTFSLGFSAGVDSNAADESFGIDNLSYSASGTGTPAPFVANASRIQAADVHTRFPRYSGCPEYRNPAPWLTMTRADLATGITMTRVAGGSKNLNSCQSLSGRGFIGGAPHLVLNYDSQNVNSNNSGLQFAMNDGNNGRTCDTTMLIRDPVGQWWFNDDQSGWNAGVRISSPISGQYVVFIGTYSRGDCTSALTINQFTSGR